MMKKRMLAALCVLSAASVFADAIDDALSRRLNVYGPAHFETYLSDATINEVIARDRQADEAWAQLKTASEIAAYRERLRAKMIAAVGGFPERTPLNVRTVATVPRDGYRIEKLLFESRPKHFVTALLFLPDEAKFPAPRPGVLVTCGHDTVGKASASNQRACVVLVQNGFAALIYDPIDQGERQQLPGTKIINVPGHVNVGLRAHLLGWGTAQFRLWDGIRALDVLAARREVDAKRLGVTGMSGGGTMSAYLNAVDTRYSAACPMGYLTSMHMLAKLCGPQDSEQIIFGQLAFGLNHLSLMLMNGGSALCPGFSYGDFFPYDGSMETFGKAVAFRAREGKAGMIDHYECAGPHCWYESEKQALARWFRHHLAGDAMAWPTDLQALRRMDVGFDYGTVDVGLANTPEGEVLEGKGVMSVEGARSVYDIMNDELDRLEKLRRPVTPEIVRKVLGCRSPAECSAHPCAVKQTAQDGLTVHTTVLEAADGMRIPVVAFVPSVVKGGPVLIVGDDAVRSKQADRVRKLVSEGRAVAVAELRGFGETGTTKRRLFWAGKGADQEEAAFRAWLGENLVARRVEDLLTAQLWFAGLTGGAKMDLHAQGGAVVAAAHAFFLARERFAAFVSERAPESWTALMRNPLLQPRFSDMVYGGLSAYDWPELVK